MHVNFFYCVLLGFLSGMCVQVGRIQGTYSNGQLDYYKEDAILSSNQSTTMSTVILELLMELSEKPRARLQILYDTENEDVFNMSKELLQSYWGGITLFSFNGSIASVSQLLTSSEGTTLLLGFCSQYNIIELFRMILREGLENFSMRWLFLSELKVDTDLIADGLEGLFHEGTHITILTGNVLGGFSIYSSQVDSNGFVRLQEVGVLGNRRRRGGGEEKRSLLSIVMPDEMTLRAQMSGRNMKVATNHYAGFFDLTGVNPDGSKKPPSGVDVEILKVLRDALNFTYEIVHPADGLWGNPLPDGTVSGLVGVIARREADFAICAVGVTRPRESVVDFTHPYYREPLAIFSRAPKEKNRALAVLSPFTLKAWVSIIACVLAIGPILAIYSKLSESLLGKSCSWSLHRCSFNMFRVIVIQGNQLCTDHWPLRFLFFSWYLFCLIISALYSGMLIAVLAIPAYETPVDSLTDLPRAVEEGFTITILKDSSDSSLFEEATEGIYQQTWELFNHEDPTESFMERPDTGIFKILEGKYLFIGFRISSEILVSKIGRSKFHIARQTFYPQSIGIACPPGAPYRDIFSHLLMRMGDAGLMAKWFRDEIDKAAQRTLAAVDIESSSSAITLTHLQAGFFIFGFGSFLASATFILENVFSYLGYFK